MKNLNIILILIVCLTSIACSNDESSNVTDGDIDNEDAIDGDTTEGDASELETDGDAEVAPPIELTPALCDDPSNLQAILQSLGSSGMSDGGVGLGMNEDELQKLFEDRRVSILVLMELALKVHETFNSFSERWTFQSLF